MKHHYKKILIAFFFSMQFPFLNAQWVTIPDPQFLQWLNNNGYSSCISGNMMDTTCTYIVNETTVYPTSYGIQSLEGIQYFDSLESLYCYNNSVLTTLPSHLPGKLTRFDCHSNQITSLPPLPKGLKYLDCRFNQITTLPSFPDSLIEISCGANPYSILPPLPASLKVLGCGNSLLTSLPPLPNSLTQLDFTLCQISTVQSLANTHLNSLYCGSNLLSVIPSLPSTLTKLYCWGNQITNLPVLPTSLKNFDCGGNLLTSLPDLPDSLYELTCWSNQLTSLPSIPKSVKNIDCRDNLIFTLPELPDTVSHIYAENNPNLTCFPAIKYIGSLTFTNTAVQCVPNYGNVPFSNPVISSLPICIPPAATIAPSGPLVFCSGGSVTLSSNPGTGFSYRWLKNGSEITGATNQTYAAATSGNYSVEVSKNCGIDTSSSVAVTVNPLPPATITYTGSATFCMGDSLILNAPAGANKTYQWKKGGNSINGATNSSFAATTGGNYKVTVTNTVTSCSKTTFNATVLATNPQPSATITPQGPTTFCAGGSVLLKGNSGTGFTYQWKKGGNNITGATNKNYTATTAGVYKIKVTNSYGCSKLSTGVAVTVPCRDEFEESTDSTEIGISVFPNPFHDRTVLKIKSQNIFNNCTLEIYNVIGEKVREIKSANKNEIVIERNSLEAGIYIFKLFGGKELKGTGKLVVQ